ncbi:receptor-type tyrosine-protein phosphatase delta-like [Amphiura filiformis]|uniref:receptor-type tyrosine-protein phosphatase delta-like n=1 Tax=Amphiura filiformis TaxID=82378 RepID=UPI003B2124A8
MSFGPTELSVNITGLEPDHEYTFTISARNGLGEGPVTEHTEKTLPLGPNPPSSVRLQSRNTYSLTFSWDDATCEGLDGCSSITGYSYKLVQASDINGRGKLGIVSDTTVTIDDLLPCTDYDFYVAATSDEGFTGPYSEAVLAQTAMIESTVSLLSVVVTDVGQTHLSFSWTESKCSERNGDIVRYSYELSGTNNVTRGETSDSSVTINNLTPYVMYSFRIAAVNSAGQGPFTEAIVSQTEEDVPPAPTGLHASNTDTKAITIQWLEPDPPHGVIIRYHIQYWMTSESMSTAMSAMNNGPTFTLSGLQPNDEYAFRVQAETSAGRGDWSTTVTAVAKEGLPSLPVELRISPAENSITLMWNTPINPNGIINEYTIDYQALRKGFDPGFISTDKYTTKNSTHCCRWNPSA